MRTFIWAIVWVALCVAVGGSLTRAQDAQQPGKQRSGRSYCSG
ncbi:MAG TPA: hypothetical protein VE262_16805 [Blastocatellia bacterium]|nr:hypothetical protein [Blastocatellia bacterium]